MAASDSDPRSRSGKPSAAGPSGEPGASGPVESQRLEVREAHVMRALSHPARFTIMEHLLRGKSGTATELAKLAGLSPSATSYHLRELAKVGLITQAAGRGDGRERVWEAPHGGLTVDAGTTGTAEAHEAERDLISMMLTVQDARTRQWLDRRRTAQPDWYEATAISEGNLLVTPEELRILNDAVHDLMKPYSVRVRDDAPEDAREVWIIFRSIPKPVPPAY